MEYNSKGVCFNELEENLALQKLQSKKELSICIGGLLNK